MLLWLRRATIGAPPTVKTKSSNERGPSSGPLFYCLAFGSGRVGNWAFGSGSGRKLGVRVGSGSGRAAGLMHDDRDDDSG